MMMRYFIKYITIIINNGKKETTRRRKGGAKTQLSCRSLNYVLGGRLDVQYEYEYTPKKSLHICYGALPVS